MGVVIMSSTFHRIDRQPPATVGTDSQACLPILGSVSAMQRLPDVVVSAATFNGALNEAARHSGLDDQEIADALHICHGYMSRFMRGVAQQWDRRLVAFCRVTQSLAPVQWMAEQLGCELVPRDSRAAEIAELRQRLQQLERAA